MRCLHKGLWSEVRSSWIILYLKFLRFVNFTELTYRGDIMKRALIVAFLLAIFSSVCFAEDFLSVSGRLNLRGVIPLQNNDTATEYPSLLGRLKVDTTPPKWRFHMWLEGGWDGSADLEAEGHSVLKGWSEVYQSTPLFLEFKELYGSYSNDFLELRAGIQRFSWGRLDEYPINDLLNPWDYTQFLRKSLEDRKIGVPSISARLNKRDWNMELVWVPLLVPYRLPLLTERWSVFPEITTAAKNYDAEIINQDGDLPSHNIENSSVGLRIQGSGTVDWGVTLFHGYDLRPVFKTTESVISLISGKVVVNPGAEPDFHKMSSIGIDAAFVKGDWSLRAEAAYAIGRYYNTRYELWGYPSTPSLGTYKLNPNEHQSDTVAYGIGVDYRLFEDCLLTMQAQQTLIKDRPDTLYDRQFETIIWANLKNFFMNQKIETNLNLAYNPEHGDTMTKVNAWYVFTDAWKVGITAVIFDGPSQSLFGRYSKNDQVEIDVIFSW
jgi:hypothetical protein